MEHLTPQCEEHQIVARQEWAPKHGKNSIATSSWKQSVQSSAHETLTAPDEEVGGGTAAAMDGASFFKEFITMKVLTVGVAEGPSRAIKCALMHVSQIDMVTGAFIS